MIWNQTYSLEQLPALYAAVEGKTVDICTVRSSTVASASLGTFFWTLLGGAVAAHAKTVNIYDFVTGNKTRDNPARLPAEEIADILSFPSNIHIYRAEHLDTTFAWEQLRALARLDRYPSTIHKDVAQALPALRAGNRTGLERMAEELAVFLQGHNSSDVVQLSAHEKETVSLVRSLPIEVNKQYYHLHTGIEGSEFRRDRIPDVATFGDRLLRGHSQGEHYFHFYDQTVSLFVQQLLLSTERAHPTPANTEKLWLADAKRNGHFFNSQIPYNENLGPEQLDPITKRLLFQKFKAFVAYKDHEQTFATFCDLSDAVHPSLLPHVLHRAPDTLPIPFDATEIHKRVAQTVDKGLTAAKSHQVDIEYVIKLLGKSGTYIPDRTKDKLVDCMMAQQLDDERIRRYSSMLPIEMHRTMSIYRKRKNRANRTPEEREKARSLHMKSQQEQQEVEAHLSNFQDTHEPTREELNALLDLHGKSMTPRQYDKWHFLLRNALRSNDYTYVRSTLEDKAPGIMNSFLYII
jgi:hypothetical protein